MMLHIIRSCLAMSIVILFNGMNACESSGEDYSRTLENQLAKGELKRAAAFFETKSQNPAHDDGAFAALGVVRFVQAVQKIANAVYRYRPDARFTNQFLLTRFAVQDNPNPDLITYDAIVQVVEDARIQIASAESALESVKGNVALTFNLAKSRVDIDGDGRAEEGENLWNLLSVINQQAPITVFPPNNPLAEYKYRFDTADIQLLRAYCHLMMASCDLFLAYDHRELFERFGYIIFPTFKSKYPKSLGAWNVDRLDSTSIYLDIASALHLCRFPLKAKERVQRAHNHLLKMIDRFKESIALANAETDLDREWYPGTQQMPVVQRAEYEKQLSEWKELLDDLESILLAKELAPYWRNPDFGINVRALFLEPSDFDLILILQGTNLERYLEKGPMCDVKPLVRWLPATLQTYVSLLGSR